MTNTIDNDAYLILVYKDFEDIIVEKYKDSDVQNVQNSLNNSASTAKTNTGQKFLKLLSAGITSSIAQNVASKVDVPDSIKGRIQSSLYDIIANGKISKSEIAQDFIGSCTNELDSIAIDMGFPNATTLYEAIGPNGAGVISKDFISLFQKKSEDRKNQIVEQKNKVAQDLTVLKFKLVPSESESWTTNLPSRKTEKGFNIVDAIENENDTKDFEISIVNNLNEGLNMYDYKDQLYDIRDKKVPFDIYVNDPYNKKQLIWKHCFFTSLNWEPDGINSLKVSISVTKIPEWEIKTESTTSIGNTRGSIKKRTKAKSKKSKSNKTSQKEKSSAGKASIGTPTTLRAINSIKDAISKKRTCYVNSDGSVKLDVVNSRLKSYGVTTSSASLGITKYGATSKRY